MSDIQNKLRACRNRFTREARLSDELQLQRDLQELDSELELRWNYLWNHWAIYYEHNGRINIICVIRPGESFREAYQDIKKNSIFTKRKLLQMQKADAEFYQSQMLKKIDDMSEEFGKQLHICTKAKVTSDGMTPNV